MAPQTLISALIASGVLLNGCASAPYTGPTPQIPDPPPIECSLPCAEPPALAPPREAWERRILDWGLSCRALHAVCADNIGR